MKRQPIKSSFSERQQRPYSGWDGRIGGRTTCVYPQTPKIIARKGRWNKGPIFGLILLGLSAYVMIWLVSVFVTWLGS